MTVLMYWDETGKWEVKRGFTVAAGGVSKAGECPAAGSAEIVHHASFGGLESEYLSIGPSE